MGIGNVDEEADIEAAQGEVKVVSMSKRIPGEGDPDEPGTVSVDPMTTSKVIIRLVRKDVLAIQAKLQALAFKCCVFPVSLSSLTPFSVSK